MYCVLWSYLNVMGDFIDFILYYSQKDEFEAKMFKGKVEKDSGESVMGLCYDHLSPNNYDSESFLKVMEMGVQHCFVVTDQFLNESLMDFLKDSSLHQSIELGENRIISCGINMYLSTTDVMVMLLLVKQCDCHSFS